MRGRQRRKRRGTSILVILSLAVIGTAGSIAMEKISRNSAIAYVNSYEAVSENNNAGGNALIDIVDSAEATTVETDTDNSTTSSTENGEATVTDGNDNGGTLPGTDDPSTGTDNINGGEEEIKEGFYVEDGGRYYYRDGEKLMGLQEIEGKTYYFSKETGRMLTGSFKVDGSWRYFEASSGAMVKGFIKLGGNTYYYAKNSGKKIYGIKRLGKNVYTFDKKGRLVRTVYGSKKAVCLTFDDGPSDNTARILDALEKNDGLATFFVVGSRLKAYSKVAKRASDMGCEIANHSYSHPNFYSLSGEAITNEIIKTNRRIFKFTGKKAEVCRTPGGAIGGVINDAVGMPIILWSVDTLDWKTRNADSTYNSVMKNARDGSVVLMHDLYSQTADAAVRMIPELTKAGYQLVTVREMSLLKRKPLKAGKVYFNFR